MDNWDSSCTRYRGKVGESGYGRLSIEESLAEIAASCLPADAELRQQRWIEAESDLLCCSGGGENWRAAVRDEKLTLVSRPVSSAVSSSTTTSGRMGMPAARSVEAAGLSGGHSTLRHGWRIPFVETAWSA